jgi:hypothetical protein
MDMAYKMSAVDHQITPLLPDAEMMLHIGNLEYANFDDNGTVGG